MKLLRWIKSAARDIIATKLRFFLTLLGILIGTASVTLLINLGVSTKKAISSSLAGLGENLVYVFYGEDALNSMGPSTSMFGGFTEAQFEKVSKALKSTGFVSLISGSARQAGSVSSNYASGAYIIHPCSADYFKIINFNLVSGRLFTDTDKARHVAIITKSLAEKLFPTHVNPVGQSIVVKGKTFQIIGVIEPTDSTMLRYSGEEVYIPLKSAHELFPSLKYTVILVKVTDLDYVSYLKPLLKQILNVPITVATQKDLITQANIILNVLTIFIGVIGGVSLIVGGIGVMNILLVSVKEKVKEIGLRKAVGATNRDILILFLIQSLIYNLIGAALGIAVGLGGELAITHVANLPFVISTKAVAAATLVSFVIGLVFGIYPAIVASRLSPVEALREE